MTAQSELKNINYYIMRIFISVHLLLVLDFLSVTTAQPSLENQVSRNEKRINGLIRASNSTGIEIKQNISSVTERVIDLEELNNSLNSTAGELIEDIGRLNEMTMELNEAVVNVEGEVTVLTGSTENVEGEVATLQLAIESNDAIIAILTGDVANLEEMVEGNNAVIANLTGEVAELEEVIENLEEVNKFVQIESYAIGTPIYNAIDYPPVNVIDGDKRTFFVNLWNPLNDPLVDTDPWLKLTFPNDAVISSIVLYSNSPWDTRPPYKLSNHTVRVLDATDEILYEDSIIGGDAVAHFSIVPPVTGRVVYVQKNNPNLDYSAFYLSEIEVLGKFQYD